jgi:Protein of unknwon function (DUF3310)
MIINTGYQHLTSNGLDPYERSYEDEVDLDTVVQEWQGNKKSNNTQIGGDHYQKQGIQPWDIIEQYDLDFFAGNIVKYILRYKYKNGLEDLQKAEHYIKKLIELEKDKK